MKNLGFHRHLAAVILGLVIAPVTQLQIAVAFRVHSVVGSKHQIRPPCVAIYACQ